MSRKFFFFIALVTFAIGAYAMSFFSTSKELKWEWPADRQISQKLLVEIVELKSSKKLVSSPSMAGNIPDPVSLRGKVLKGDAFKKNAVLTLQLPKVELGDATEGSIVMLGMVNNETVVCIKNRPGELSETQEDEWLKGLQCN